MITQQLVSWKESIIEESKVTKITNSKGGKVVEIPLEFPKPKELSNLLWNTLQSRYNSSQLYAIYHVISQHQPPPIIPAVTETERKTETETASGTTITTISVELEDGEAVEAAATTTSEKKKIIS